MRDVRGPRLSALQRLVAVTGSSVVVVVFACILYLSLAHQAATRAAADHTQRVLRAVQTVRTRLLDAETGQRGFLLTGREQYLAPFAQAERDVTRGLDTLHDLADGNTIQQAQLDTLTRFVRNKFDELKATIALRRTSGLTPALTLLRTDEGIRAMTESRRLARAIEHDEIEVLTARSEREAHLAGLIRWVLIGGALLAVLVALFLNSLLSRSAAEQADTARELDARNKLLEEQSAELKRTAQARREGEEHLHLAVAAGSQGSWEWNVQSGEVTWSPEVERMHGMEVGTFPGTFDAYRSDIFPDDRERVLAAIQSAVENRTLYHLTYRIARADSEVRWLETHGQFILDDRGEPFKLVGVCMDITERHHADNALHFTAQASAQLTLSLDYEQALENIARIAVPALADWCAVDIRDEDGTLRRLIVTHSDEGGAARNAESSTRYADGPMSLGGSETVVQMGRTEWAEEIPDAFLATRAVDAAHLQFLRTLGLRSYIAVPFVTGTDVLGVLTLYTAGSGRRYTEADVLVVEDVARRAAIAIDRSRMVTQAERARAAAEEANGAKSEFLAAMSHELRTPLNAITGYADLLAMGLRGPTTHEQLEDLNRIKKSGNHLLSLINDILNFARVDSGHVDLNITDVDISDIAESVDMLIAPQMRANGIAYEWHDCDPACCVHADREKVQQIIINLLTNAIKFTDRGGRVSVDCEVMHGGSRDIAKHGTGNACDSSGDVVVLRIQDTGRGIAPNRLASIFEPFVQIDRHLTHHSHQGVGLGLAISRELAQAMGGDITVQSDVGKGSTFTLALPSSC